MNSQPESHKVKLQRQVPHAAAARPHFCTPCCPDSGCSPHPRLTSCPSFGPQLRNHLSGKTFRVCLLEWIPFNSQALFCTSDNGVHFVNVPSLSLHQNPATWLRYPFHREENRLRDIRQPTFPQPETQSWDSHPGWRLPKPAPCTAQAPPGPANARGNREMCKSSLASCDHGFRLQLLFFSQGVSRMSDRQGLPGTLPFIKLSAIRDLLVVFA